MRMPTIASASRNSAFSSIRTTAPSRASCQFYSRNGSLRRNCWRIVLPIPSIKPSICLIPSPDISRCVVARIRPTLEYFFQICTLLYPNAYCSAITSKCDTPITSICFVMESLSAFRQEKLDLLAKIYYNSRISDHTSAAARPVQWAGRFVYFSACRRTAAGTFAAVSRICG